MTYLYEALQLIFDAIMADLPYGTTACTWDTIIPFEPLWENYKRLVKSNGAAVLFGSQPFTSLLVASNIEWFKYEWIWDKVSKTDIFNAKNKPLKRHENILIFSNGTTANGSHKKMFYNPLGITPGTRKTLQTKTNFGEAMSPRRESHILGYYEEQGSNYPSSIIEISNADRTNPLHPTQKPVDLLAYLIRTYTNPGEIILDNTMGSGTTLVAAQREGRRAIGIDISEEYCAIAADRLRQPSFFSIPDKPKNQPAEQLSLSLK
jgi:site-specific DNA-methyltransferase (adenine-specific)